MWTATAFAWRLFGGVFVALAIVLLAFVFFYISLDEFSVIHENLNQYFEFEGVLYYGWVLPAGACVLLLGLSYIRFLRALPQRTALLFISSGCLFVGGALGVELILGWWVTQFGSENLGYGLIDWVEESLELSGAGLFSYSLLELMFRENPQIRLVFSPKESQE